MRRLTRAPSRQSHVSSKRFRVSSLFGHERGFHAAPLSPQSRRFASWHSAYGRPRPRSVLRRRLGPPCRVVAPFRSDRSGDCRTRRYLPLRLSSSPQLGGYDGRYRRKGVARVRATVSACKISVPKKRRPYTSARGHIRLFCRRNVADKLRQADVRHSPRTWRGVARHGGRVIASSPLYLREDSNLRQGVRL